VTLVRYLHLLAMAFFAGGQLFLVAAVVPSLRADVDRARLRSIARRFGWGTLRGHRGPDRYGHPLASHFHRWGSATLHVKFGFLLVVVVLIVWHLRRPQTHAVEGGIFSDRSRSRGSACRWLTRHHSRTSPGYEPPDRKFCPARVAKRQEPRIGRT
jgi:hypothetical protein